MKSQVKFQVIPSIEVEEGVPTSYAGGNIACFVEDGNLQALSIVFEHEDFLLQPEIVSAAKARLFALSLLLSFGRNVGFELSNPEVVTIVPPTHRTSRGILSIGLGVFVATKLTSLPDEALLDMLEHDERLQRQIEFLNIARAADGDLVKRILNLYKVLEEEEGKRRNTANPYVVPNEYRYNRNAVSHAFLTGDGDKKYFRRELGVDFPDLKIQSHHDFMLNQSILMMREATQIVETYLSAHKFW